jgi:hypothetical protein
MKLPDEQWEQDRKEDKKMYKGDFESIDQRMYEARIVLKNKYGVEITGVKV